MNVTKVMQVIYTNESRTGEGTWISPIRMVEKILDFDGNIIMEKDAEVAFTKKDLYNFATYVKRHANEGVIQQSNEELLEGYFKGSEISF